MSQVFIIKWITREEDYYFWSKSREAFSTLDFRLLFKQLISYIKGLLFANLAWVKYLTHLPWVYTCIALAHTLSQVLVEQRRSPRARESREWEWKKEKEKEEEKGRERERGREGRRRRGIEREGRKGNWGKETECEGEWGRPLDLGKDNSNSPSRRRHKEEAYPP